MSWYRVAIRDDVVNESAVALMGKFEKAYRDAGVPPNVRVYRGRGAAGEHVFVFSPEASAVAAALLREFSATRLHYTPDLKALKLISV